MRAHGITNFHVCVDKKYWKANQTTEGYCIECFEDLFRSVSEKFDIIVAFYGFELDFIERYMGKFGNHINVILYEDIFPHFWMEPCVFCVSRNFYEKYDSELTKLYEGLEDNKSKEVLLSFIEQRISGDYKYSENILSDRQNEYFAPDVIKEMKNLTLIDCGAFDGNDTKKFFDFYEGELFSYVIEPDEDNMCCIEKNLNEYVDYVMLIKKAILDVEAEFSFSSGGGEGSGLAADGDEKVLGISIDNLYQSSKVHFNNRTIIKMDIEGAEKKALQGAENFIKEKKPILVICVYHKPEDIIELPRLIKEMEPSYKFYLRRYNQGFYDTVLYAI